MQSPANGTTTLFVGLGRMGEPMARRHATHATTLVFDADAPAMARLADAPGTHPLPALDTVPPEVGTVILMLPDSRVVESVLLGRDGDDGLLGRLSPDTLVIDMGSSEPSSTRALARSAADRGIAYVDAPVSGGVAKAATGELAIMVGGQDELVGRAMPHLEPLGSTIVHVGPAGTGHAAKALNNLLSATNLAAAAEVLCLAQQEGIAPAVMVEVLNSSTGRSQATEVKYPQHVLTGTFASGFAMDLMLKDLAIASRLGTSPTGAPSAGSPSHATPITDTTVRTLTEARAVLGREGMDHTEIVTYYETLTGALIRDQHTSDSQHTAPTERTHP